MDIRTILYPPPCKTLAEVPAAISRWESQIRILKARTGKDIVEDDSLKKVLSLYMMPDAQSSADMTKEMNKSVTWTDFKSEIHSYVDRLCGTARIPGQQAVRKDPSRMDVKTHFGESRFLDSPRDRQICGHHRTCHDFHIS